jgi:hypothetical protein
MLRRFRNRRTAAAAVMMEAIEGRTLLSTYTVTNTNDTGAGSFRQAILDANKHLGTDTINFKIGSGLKTISPKSGLPAINQPTIIDATTQGGYAGKPLIEVSGAYAGTCEGIRLTGGASTLKGMIINRFANSGVFIYAKGGNKIVNCYIGTNATGTAALPNKAHGIFCQTDNNTIGGTTSGERNVISGNTKAGVFFYLNSAHHNKVMGNYMGTDVTGTKAIANQNAVHVNAGQYNTIGGLTAGARNILSGNIHDGVLINSGNAKGNQIQGNYIGTNAAGTGRLGNGWYGVEISQPENVVGGTVAGARNVISASGYAGIALYLVSGANNRVEGNYIGTDYTGTKDLGNIGAGVDITNGGKNNIVGGTTAAARNVIAGNDRVGVGIYNSSVGNQVIGNWIGICSNGCALLNAKNGVLINNNSSGNMVKNNRIAWVGGTYKAIQISSGSTTQAGTNTLYSGVANGLKLV